MFRLTIVPAVLILCITFLLSLRFVKSDHRLVIFRLRRFYRIAGPGVRMVNPLFDRGVDVNLNRTVPGWERMTRQDIEARILDILKR
jgi:regulator of protease activity HflC (stomatin/prohibitin superfamily)